MLYSLVEMYVPALHRIMLLSSSTYSIFVYELNRLHTLFLVSVYFSFDSSPLHVSAVFQPSSGGNKLKDFVTQI
jgi:hypothetical protein